MFRWELTAMAICVLVTFERSLVRLFFTAKPNVHEARIALRTRLIIVGLVRKWRALND
jgi:hypothetical protein